MAAEPTNRGTIAVVAAPLIALTIVDYLVLTFSFLGPLKGLGWYRVVMYGHLLFAPAIFWVVVLASRLGKRGPPVGLSALVLSYIVMTRFRGPWVWQGTFDYYFQTQQPWLWSSFAGALGGLLYVLAQARFGDVPKQQPPPDLPYLVALAVCAATVMVVARLWRFDSIFAPTLDLALGLCAVVLAVLWGLVVRPEEALK